MLFWKDARLSKELDSRAAGRAIKYAGVLGGLSLVEINSLLRSVALKDLPESSYEMIRKNDVKLFTSDLKQLGECIRSPKSASEIRRMTGN